MIAEQLPCQQSRETAGPQIHSGPPHQYYLLQNEGTVPALSFRVPIKTQHLNDECNVSVNFISVLCAFRSKSSSLHLVRVRW